MQSHQPPQLQTIIERAVRLLNAHGGSLFLREPGQTQIRCMVSVNCPSDVPGEVYEADQGAAGRVACTGQPMVINDYLSWDGHVPQPEEAKPISAVVSVPMNWEDKVIGVLNVLDIRPNRVFTPNDLEIISVFADQAAIAVENARLLQAERRQREHAEILREITSVLSTSLEHEQVLQMILEQLARVVNYDSASLMLVNQSRLEIVAHSKFKSEKQGYVSLRIPELRHVQEVIQARSPIIISDTSQDPRWKPTVDSEYIRSWLGVPLVSANGVLGLLNLDKIIPGFYTEQDAELAATFANQATIAIENARLYEAAQNRAQEAETLRQATAAVISSLNLEDALNSILVQLERVIPFDCASVQMLRDGYLEAVCGRGWYLQASIEGQHFPLADEQPQTLVIQERRPLILDEAPAYGHEVEGQKQIRSWMGVPLMVHDQVTGMLSLGSTQTGFYDENQARVAAAFADQVAIVIENARLYTAERRQVDELNALRATFADISAELPLPLLLQSLLERAVTMLDATGGELGLYDEARAEVKIVTSYNLPKDFTGTEMVIGEGAMGKAIENRELIIINDYSQWEGRSRQYDDVPWHALQAVPFLIGQRLVGAISIVDKRPDRQFSPGDQRLLNLFAQQAAIAVENARLYQTAKEAAERRAVLHEASQEIVAVTLDPEGIYKAIHQSAAKVMNTEAFVIALKDDARQVIDAVYLMDKSGRGKPFDIPLKRGLSGQVIDTGKSIKIEDMIEELERIDSIHFGAEEEVRSILAVPLSLGGKVIGMLSAQSYTPYVYTQEDQHLLEMLASYAAIALDNARLFREVQRLAITDDLTGINNRRQLFVLGQREFSRARRFQRALSVILLDVDFFKQINDRYGHSTGDMVLQQLGQRFQANVREVDILGRYGGEEFVVILPETPLSSAILAAERLRAQTASNPILDNDRTIPVTISAGIASLTDDIPNLAALIAEADIALYEAKNGGRNRVVGRI